MVGGVRVIGAGEATKEKGEQSVAQGWHPIPKKYDLRDWVRSTSIETQHDTIAVLTHKKAWDSWVHGLIDRRTGLLWRCCLVMLLLCLACACLAAVGLCQRQWHSGMQGPDYTMKDYQNRVCTCVSYGFTKYV